jgi:hypothetical protein
MAITPISRNSSDDLDFLFEEATLDESWSEFGSHYNSKMLHIKHRDPYSLRFIGPLIPIRRFYLDKSNTLRRYLSTDDFKQALRNNLSVTQEERLRNRGDRAMREYTKIIDRDQWEKGIIGNAFVRNAKDKSIVGKVLVHTLNENDLKLISTNSRKNKNVTGVCACDIKIHNVGSGTELKRISSLDSEEIKKILRQGLHDLVEFIRDNNNDTAKKLNGYFYDNAVPNKKLSASYLDKFWDALSTVEEDREVEHFRGDPQKLLDSGMEEIPIVPMIDIG